MNRPVFAIKVVWLDGEEELLRGEGSNIARFTSRKKADEMRSFMLEGMAGEVQSINVVQYEGAG